MLQLPIFILSLPLLLWLPHPHHPKTLIMAGVNGKVTVQHITVPFNAEHLKDLQPGFSWHLGFAQLSTDIPLGFGDITVQPGKYKMDVHRGDKDDSWSVALYPAELMRARWAVRRASRQGEEAVQAAKTKLAELQKELAAKGQKEYLLPAESYAEEHQEHLILYSINRGYARKGRQDQEALTGMDCSLRLSFGDLHQEIRFIEQLPKED